jgi:carbon-monoxide dehydrogenase large subunit
METPKKFGIGQPLSRFEDKRFITGGGRFQEDRNLPGQVCAVFVRSPHANARIVRLDTAEASAMPGVLAVLTGDDVAADKLGTTRPAIPRKRPDGSPMYYVAHPGLARGHVHYVGDPFAMVVAESLLAAKDAAERINVEFEDLPSVTATADAVGGTGHAVWPDCPDNVSHVWSIGDGKAVADVFAAAAHTIKRRYTVTRVHAQYMEPRGALGAYDPSDERFTLYADCQYPHRVREMLATQVFNIPTSQIRVVAGDVGGAFGTKGWQYVEHRLVLWAARKLGRPVKWTCERGEVLMADEHGRDCIIDSELALDRDGRFLAVRVNTDWNIGAYLSSDRNMLQTFTSMQAATGCYDIPHAFSAMRALFSNLPATAPYRGAGRPEAIFALERIIDDASREFGFDRIELRRRNLVHADAMPYRNALGFIYDSGDYAKSLDMALGLAGVAGFPERKAASLASGKLRGLGIVNGIERAAPPSPEYAQIIFDTGGGMTLLMGTKNQGQGHETTFRQIACDSLGIHPDDIRYVDGDTDVVPYGLGTMGSRSTVTGGTAVRVATTKILEKARAIAAHALDVAPDALDFADGQFKVPATNKVIGLKDVAKLSFLPGRIPKGMEAGLAAMGSFTPDNDTFPSSCHVCEVEIDPETGVSTLASYLVVDDVGTVINPKTLEGQLHGGIVQGLGQVFMERVAYDRETGQLINAYLTDYTLPRADDVCNFTVKSNPHPSPLNPLGAKGAGEAGTVGALSAAMNAVLDALSQVGVRDFDMPATPDRVWAAINAAASPRKT